MRTTILVCALIACLASRALADPNGPNNVIYQHNPNYQQGTHYTIRPAPFNDVTIIVGIPGQDFQLEAVRWDGDPNDPNSYVGPGDIFGITADPNAGTVAITIVGNISPQHDPNQDYGARDVGLIDLDALGVDGTIAALTVSRNAGTLGPITPHARPACWRWTTILSPTLRWTTSAQTSTASACATSRYPREPATCPRSSSGRATMTPTMSSGEWQRGPAVGLRGHRRRRTGRDGRDRRSERAEYTRRPSSVR